MEEQEDSRFDPDNTRFKPSKTMVLTAPNLTTFPVRYDTSNVRTAGFNRIAWQEVTSVNRSLVWISADQAAAFIVNNGGDIYTRQQLYDRMKDLELVHKRAWIEAYDAYTPRNLNMCRWFWNDPPPLGIVGVQRR
mmetsp:Transcript_15238/g.25344  ORF Transcript_15238/g.25344 Transcript_15238/m.25344 type:complete len:135 (+) Transcript_15238:230-634(+)